MRKTGEVRTGNKGKRAHLQRPQTGPKTFWAELAYRGHVAQHWLPQLWGAVESRVKWLELGARATLGYGHVLVYEGTSTGPIL